MAWRGGKTSSLTSYDEATTFYKTCPKTTYTHMHILIHVYVSVLNNTIEQIKFVSTNKTKKTLISNIRLMENYIRGAKSGLNILNLYRLFFLQLSKNLYSTLNVREQD